MEKAYISRTMRASTHGNVGRSSRYRAVRCRAPTCKPMKRTTQYVSMCVSRTCRPGVREWQPNGALKPDPQTSPSPHSQPSQDGYICRGPPGTCRVPSRPTVRSPQPNGDTGRWASSAHPASYPPVSLWLAPTIPTPVNTTDTLAPTAPTTPTAQPGLFGVVTWLFGLPIVCHLDRRVSSCVGLPTMNRSSPVMCARVSDGGALPRTRMVLRTVLLCLLWSGGVRWCVRGLGCSRCCCCPSPCCPAQIPFGCCHGRTDAHVNNRLSPVCCVLAGTSVSGPPSALRQPFGSMAAERAFVGKPQLCSDVGRWLSQRWVPLRPSS